MPSWEAVKLKKVASGPARQHLRVARKDAVHDQWGQGELVYQLRFVGAGSIRVREAKVADILLVRHIGLGDEQHVGR